MEQMMAESGDFAVLFCPVYRQCFTPLSSSYNQSWRLCVCSDLHSVCRTAAMKKGMRTKTRQTRAQQPERNPEVSMQQSRSACPVCSFSARRTLSDPCLCRQEEQGRLRRVLSAVPRPHRFVSLYDDLNRHGLKPYYLVLCAPESVFSIAVSPLDPHLVLSGKHHINFFFTTHSRAATNICDDTLPMCFILCFLFEYPLLLLQRVYYTFSLRV